MMTMGIGVAAGIFYWLAWYKLAFWILIYAIIYGGLGALRGDNQAHMLLRRDSDQERNEHIDMTPMVDVVFQLMTFMLFSVQMSGGEKVDIPPARHGVGVEEVGGDQRQGRREHVLLTVTMASKLQPAIELTMMMQ